MDCVEEKIKRFVLGPTGNDWIKKGWENNKRREIVVSENWDKTSMGKEWEEILDNFDPARELLFSY